jgi:hypothetical protein
MNRAPLLSCAYERIELYFFGRASTLIGGDGGVKMGALWSRFCAGFSGAPATQLLADHAVAWTARRKTFFPARGAAGTRIVQGLPLRCSMFSVGRSIFSFERSNIEYSTSRLARRRVSRAFNPRL